MTKNINQTNRKSSSKSRRKRTGRYERPESDLENDAQHAEAFTFRKQLGEDIARDGIERIPEISRGDVLFRKMGIAQEIGASWSRIRGKIKEKKSRKKKEPWIRSVKNRIEITKTGEKVLNRMARRWSWERGPEISPRDLSIFLSDEMEQNRQHLEEDNRCIRRKGRRAGCKERIPTIEKMDLDRKAHRWLLERGVGRSIFRSDFSKSLLTEWQRDSKETVRFLQRLMTNFDKISDDQNLHLVLQAMGAKALRNEDDDESLRSGKWKDPSGKVITTPPLKSSSSTVSVKTVLNAKKEHIRNVPPLSRPKIPDWDESIPAIEEVSWSELKARAQGMPPGNVVKMQTSSARLPKNAHMKMRKKRK